VGIEDIPLIYTVNGNVPVDSLKHECEWIVNDDYIQFIERYRNAENVVVKESAHVYSKHGFAGKGSAVNFA